MGRKRKKTTALLAAFDQAEAVIYALDREQVIVYANETCGHWLGLETADLIGRQCTYPAIDATAPETLPLAPPPSAWSAVDPYVQTLPLGIFPLGATCHVLRVDGEPEALLVVGKLEPDGASETDDLLESEELHRRLLKLRSELTDTFRIANLLGDSPVMAMVRQQAAIAGASTSNVLLVGEPGTGRQTVARAIHQKGSGGKASIAQIACPVSGAEMLQAAVKAFLRRQAELGEETLGTLLLTDVDQLPADAQHELAGFLALPNVRLRLIGTSRTPLTDLEAFDRQLAYQLSPLMIRLPSLRERRADIPLLAQHFLEQTAVDADAKPEGFSTEAIDRLLTYDWPGNLPQLADAIHTACETCCENLIPAEGLPDFLIRAEEAAKRTTRDWQPIKLDTFLEEIETEVIKEALRYAGGNKTQASKLLGISRARLIRRVQQLGLGPEIDFEEIE